jgi:hypothetical protein
MLEGSCEPEMTVSLAAPRHGVALNEYSYRDGRWPQGSLTARSCRRQTIRRRRTRFANLSAATMTTKVRARPCSRLLLREAMSFLPPRPTSAARTCATLIVAPAERRFGRTAAV